VSASKRLRPAAIAPRSFSLMPMLMAGPLLRLLPAAFVFFTIRNSCAVLR
jgi:hypothetical protein